MTLDLYLDPHCMAASALPVLLKCRCQCGLLDFCSVMHTSVRRVRTRRASEGSRKRSKPDLNLQLCLKITTASRASDILGIRLGQL